MQDAVRRHVEHADFRGHDHPIILGQVVARRRRPLRSCLALRLGESGRSSSPWKPWAGSRPGRPPATCWQERTPTLSRVRARGRRGRAGGDQAADVVVHHHHGGAVGLGEGLQLLRRMSFPELRPVKGRPVHPRRGASRASRGPAVRRQSSQTRLFVSPKLQKAKAKRPATRAPLDPASLRRETRAWSARFPTCRLGPSGRRRKGWRERKSVLS